MYGISGLFMTKYTEEVMVDGKSIVIHFWYQENRNSPNWTISNTNQPGELECVSYVDLTGPYWTLLDLTSKKYYFS